MNTRFEEKRRHVRIFFPADANVTALIASSPDDKGGPVKILNLSEGGLQLSQARTGGTGLKTGDTGVISDIQGYRELTTIEAIPIQIRWLMDNSYFDNIVFGVQFLELSPSSRDILRDFVADWIVRFGTNKE